MGALTFLWLFPAAAALCAWLVPTPRASRAVALVSTAFLLAYSLWLMAPFSAQIGTLRLEEMCPASVLGIRYRVGVDGLSLALCWLTTLLTFLALAVPGEHPNGYWASFLALESGLLGLFVSQNLFFFYIFWEVILIPMFFIIGIWGSSGRRHAAFKFILYTFLGSLFLLVGFIALPTFHHQATGAWSWDIPDLVRTPFALPGSPLRGAAAWIYAAIALGFAVKIPLLPLHNWLPDAHTEAPAAGSVILAGVMLKAGVYGFLRILLPVFPDISAAALPWLGALGVANILYGALCAMVQTDLKRLIAYTSISHLGFCLVGMYSLTGDGLAGASLQMINHGLSTGALFLMVGMIYDRVHRRGVADFGGLDAVAPRLAFFFAFVLLSSIGLPGLNGFVGEMMSLTGMARVSLPLAALGVLGGVLAAAYALPAFQRVFWAPAGEGSATPKMTDLVMSERAILWTLCALILWLGLYPQPVIRLLEPSLSPLVAVR
ncbi:MAG: NADH-quinone oxidoreductase subunit M [Elusimicrobia bacterium]|nr:NADH-quinone oxidoreductase subunit M [Elusimicrobiota bacterium]